MKWSELTNFTDKQKECLEIIKKHRYVLYGGAKGGGKSRFVRWWLVQVLIELYKQGLWKPHVMLACETYNALTDRQISKINIEFPRWLGDIARTQEDQLVFQLRDSFGGGVIMLRNLDDPNKYAGVECAAIAIDQIEKVQIDVFNVLRGNLRYPGVPRPRFVATANPGGIGHAWVKQLWVDRKFPPELIGMEHEFAFVQATVYDNPHVEESYIDELKTLPENLRKAWLEGDWTIFSGQAFTNFGASHIIEPFDIPMDWIRIRGIDYGLTSPFGCVWLARNPDMGRYIVYKELKKAGLTDTQQARYIREMTGSENINVSYGGHDFWAKKSTKDIITCSATAYADEGIYLSRGDTDRINGKHKIDRLLENLPDSKPGLQVFSNCKHTINCLQYLVLDEKNPEDVDTKQDDHMYDALRYALTAARTYVKPPIVKRSNPWEKVKVI